MTSHHNLTPPAETPPTLSDGVMAPTGASTPLQFHQCRECGLTFVAEAASEWVCPVCIVHGFDRGRVLAGGGEGDST